MKATQTFTLRVPSVWQSLGSGDVRSMLAAYLQRPTPNLPVDPGPGNARLSLSLPARAVKVVSALLNENESAALRRIIAASRGLPWTVQARSLPMERPRTRILEAEVIRPRALLSARFDSGAREVEALLGRSMEGEGYKARVRAGFTQVLAEKPAPSRAQQSLISVLWGDSLFRIFLVAVAVLVGLALYFGGAPHGVSDSAESTPDRRFRPWSPKTT